MAEQVGPVVAPNGGGSGRSPAELLRHATFLEANLSAIPDYVYAFDRKRRFIYANPTMLALFGLTADQMLGRTFEELNYPEDLADLLNSHIDRIFADAVTVEDEVFFHSPTGHAAYFAYLWGPVWGEDGSVKTVIGVSRDTSRRRAYEEALRTSEALFRSFAAHSSNLIWMVDPAANEIIYRSAAYERIWGVSCDEAPTDIAEWMHDVHPDDRAQVRHALESVKAGEVAEFEYRIVRPGDGTTRWLRDTSFPIPDDTGAVTRIGGITEDLTRTEVSQVYIVSSSQSEGRKLGNLVRAFGHRARSFDSASAFLEVAAVLASGCVLLDLRRGREDGLSASRELKARSIALPVVAIGASDTDADAAVATMKAGAVDCVIANGDASFGPRLSAAIDACHGSARSAKRDESAGARLAKLTSREREVLAGLVDGGTNKVIAQKLAISPRTVELHRSQLMNRLGAASLPELLQIAIAAGMMPAAGSVRVPKRTP